jgi:hypothetical protein
MSTWQNAFVATSVAIGVSVEDAASALEDPHAVEGLIHLFKMGTREARARAIAQHLAPIAAELEAMEATWRA